MGPCGDRLALRAGRDIHDPTDGRILIVSSDGGDPQIIDHDFEGKYEQISWFDNDNIHFLASEGVLRSFGTIQPDGNGKQSMIEAGDLIIDSFELSDNDITLFTANTSTHPNDIFITNRRDRQPKRMTETNSWLKEVGK